MKTAEEKAKKFIRETVLSQIVSGTEYSKLKQSIIILLKEQDLDTRNACAEAVNNLVWWCGNNNECVIDRDEAHFVCMNAKAL